MLDKKDTVFYKRVIFVAAAFLVVVNIGDIFQGLKSVLRIAFPLFVGAVIAFIINIPMSKLEKLYFPKSKNKFVNSSRRPVCIITAIALVITVFAVIIKMVLPSLGSAFGLMFKNVPIYFDKALDFIAERADAFPDIEKWINSIEVDWAELAKKISEYITGGIGAVLNSTIQIAGMLTSFIIDFVMSFIFAIYLLFAKERMLNAGKRAIKVFIKDDKAEVFIHFLKVVNDTFSKFIAGQCIEAVILGVLCIIGMLIIRLPYAFMVGAVMGATALIPMLGAYLGAAIGAFLIFTVSPVKAVIFVLFTVILQQFEGNVVYPRVVGTSIGLPGIFVFVAVLVGGGMAGIPGMLIGVPATASAYKLFKEYLNYKEKKARL